MIVVPSFNVIILQHKLFITYKYMYSTIQQQILCLKFLCTVTVSLQDFLFSAIMKSVHLKQLNRCHLYFMFTIYLFVHVNILQINKNHKRGDFFTFSAVNDLSGPILASDDLVRMEINSL